MANGIDWDRQATRTQSADRGNIRYGTRGANFSATQGPGPYGNWMRNFRNQYRDTSNVMRLRRGYNRNGSR